MTCVTKCKKGMSWGIPRIPGIPGFPRIPRIYFTCSLPQESDTHKTPYTIHGYDMQQMYVKGAYLDRELEELIYMMQPPGCEDGSKSVLLLIHSLYGLKKSGGAWYHKLKEILLKHNLKQVAVEHCLYIWHHNGNLQIISAWVDDLLLIGPVPDSTNEIKIILGWDFGGT